MSNMITGDMDAYTIEVSAQFMVTVPYREPGFNGQDTTQRDAVRLVEFRMEQALRSCETKWNKEGIYRLAAKGDIEDAKRPEARPVYSSQVDINDRLFDSMIFLGNGDFSEERSSVLQDRLESALSWLGGLQQGPDSEDGRGNRYIENVARDIVMALTGKEFVFVEEPPK